MGRLILVVGGTKSGKSRHAAALAADTGRPVVVVTPAEVRDPDFAARVARHRRDRPTGWHTEETFDVVGVLQRVRDHTVVVDALDTWLLERSERAGMWAEEAPSAEEAVLDEVRRLADAAAARDGVTIVVAGELGSAPHPITAAARRYVDLHGSALQILGGAADEVWLTVAGRALRLP